MQLEFAKMHGLGNDFMVLDLVTQVFELDGQRIRAWSDRRTGVGFDQLLAIEPPSDPDADFRYRIFNADGAEVEQCGNGARCAALFVARRQLSPKPVLVLQTMNGAITTRLLADDQVEVDMGEPRLAPELVPFDPYADGSALPVTERLPAHRLTVDGEPLEITPVSMGNPHGVLFVGNVAEAPSSGWAARWSHIPCFPRARISASARWSIRVSCACGSTSVASAKPAPAVPAHAQRSWQRNCRGPLANASRYRCPVARCASPGRARARPLE
jgi:diaminopimelate epimerase